MKVRLSEIELRAFQTKAAHYGISLSEWVRFKLREQLTPEELKAAAAAPFEGKGIKP